MNKEDFIQEIRSPLKSLGFRKNGNYWFKEQNDLLQCIFVQGSQWDKNDYYVEIGAAPANSDRRFPTLLHWEFRHRCVDAGRRTNHDVNIPPSVLFDEMEKIFSGLTDAAHLTEYYQTHNVIGTANRYVL